VGRLLDAVEKYLKTMGYRNRGEKWRMGNNGGQKKKEPKLKTDCSTSKIRIILFLSSCSPATSYAFFIPLCSVSLHPFLYNVFCSVEIRPGI